MILETEHLCLKTNNLRKNIQKILERLAVRKK